MIVVKYQASAGIDSIHLYNILNISKLSVYFLSWNLGMALSGVGIGDSSK